MLEVPVVLGDVIDRALASKDGCKVDEREDPAQSFDRGGDQRVVTRDIAEVHRQRDVPRPFQRAHDLVEWPRSQVDGHDPGPGRCERARHRAHRCRPPRR